MIILKNDLFNMLVFKQSKTIFLWDIYTYSFKCNVAIENKSNSFFN